MSLPLKKNFIANKVASELSGYSTDYIARLCREGKIDGAQVGRGWVVDKESLERFIRQQDERKREMARELSRAREREYRSRRSASFLAGFSTRIAREETTPVNHARPEPRVRRSGGPRLSHIHRHLRGGFAFAVTSLVIMSAVLASQSDVLPAIGARIIAASIAINGQERPLPERTALAFYRIGNALEGTTAEGVIVAPKAYHATVLALAATPADVAPAAAIAPTSSTTFGQMLALMSESFTGFVDGIRNRIALAFGLGNTRITIVPFDPATMHVNGNTPVVETASGAIALTPTPTKEAITTVVTSGVSADYVQSFVSSYVNQALSGLSARIGGQVLDGQYVHPSFSIGPAGSEQTNPHVTFDTASTTTNGLTSLLSITASNNAIHFVPSTSGTLTLSGGGTGTTTWYGGGLVFSDGTKLTQSSTSGYTALYWDNANSRLGLGTTTPNDNLVVSSSGTPVITLNSDNATNGQAEIHFDVAGKVENYLWQEYQPGNGVNDIAIGNGSGTTAFRVGTGGDVSIGGWVPGYDYATSTRALNVTGFGNTSSTYTAYFQNHAGTSLLAVRDDGTIGIGTTTPQAQLHIVNTGSPATLTLESTSGNARFQLKNGAGNYWNIITQSSDSGLRFQYNGNTSFFLSPSGMTSVGGINSVAVLSVSSTTATVPYLNVGNVANNYFTVANNGSVGVGTTSPGYTFAVNGDGYFTGNLQVGNNLVIQNGSVSVGSATSTFAINGSINSNLVPAVNKSYDLGSPSFFWRNGYIDSLTVNNLGAASTTISGTASQSFTINSANGTADTQDMQLIFFRGIVVPNAVLSWNHTLARFEFNQPTYIKNQSSTTTVPTLTLAQGTSQTGDILQLQNATGGVLDTFTSAGNLGIGTTSPWAQLAINPNGISGPAFAIGSSTRTLLEVNNNGSFLYGTTTQRTNGFNLANVNGSARTLWVVNDQTNGIPLDLENYNGGIGQTVQIDFAAGDSTGNSANSYGRIGSVITNNTPGSWGGDFTIQAQSRGQLHEVARFTGGWNVGIGTTSPYAILSVASSTSTGILAAFEAPVAKVRVYATGGNGAYTAYGENGLRDTALVGTAPANGLIAGASAGDLNLAAYTRNIVFSTASGGASAQAIITSSGNFGIGTTTPGSLLQVAGIAELGVHGATDGVIQLDQAQNSNSAQITYTNNQLKLKLGNNGTLAFVDGSGATTAGFFGSNNSLSFGIGTTSPWAQLSVNPNGITGPAFAIGSSTGELFTVDNNGKTQIGSPTNGSVPYYPFSVNLPAQDSILADFRAGNTSGIEIGSADFANNGVGRGIWGASGGSLGLNNYAGAIVFQTSNGGIPAERLRVDSVGNVGIGTTTPDARLVIAGSGQSTANLSTSANLGASLVLNDTNTAGASGSGGSLIFGGTGSGGNLGRFAAIKGLLTNSVGNSIGDLAFSTRNATGDSTLTERLRITSGGNVGIGTTSPADNLDVYTATDSGLSRIGLIRGDGAAYLTQWSYDTSGHGFLEIGENEAFNSTGSTRIQFNTGAPSWFQQFNVNTDSYLIGRIPAGGSSATQLMTINNQGYVGIGTTSPWAQLSVNPAGVSGPEFAIGSSTATHFIVTNGGNVGIGTTNPVVALQIASGSIRLDNNQSIQIKDNANGPVAVLTIDASNNLSVRSSETNGDAYFGLSNGAATGSVHLQTAGANQLNILSNGNVGIGTTTPAGKLDVFGTANIGDASTAFSGSNQLNIINSAGAVIRFGNASGSGIISADGGGTTIGSFTNHNLFLKTNNTARVTIDTSGNVGIGTSTPSTTLHVVNNSGASILLLQSTSGNTNFQSETADGNIFGLQFTNGSPLWRLQYNGATKSTFNSSGYLALGSGVASALNPLYVAGGATIGSASFNIAAPTNGVLVEGNVGIGTTSPWAQLSVNPTSSLNGAPEFVIGSSSATHLAVYGNGSVALGGTFSPPGTLGIKAAAGGDVLNWYNLSGVMVSDQGVDAGGNSRIRLRNSTGTTVIELQSSSVNPSYINAGNFGIGTSTPDVPLEVYKAGGTTLALDGTNVGGENRAIQFRFADGIFADITKAGSTGDLTVNNHWNANLILSTNNAERVRVTGTGNVGIGTTTPTARLSIHANNGDTNTNLFMIGSSTASATTTLFSVSNTGVVNLTATSLSSNVLNLNTTSGFTAAALGTDGGGAGLLTLDNSSGTGIVQLNGHSSGFGGTGTSISITGSSAFNGAAQTYNALSITPLISQSGTSGFSGIFVNPNITSTGSGNNYLLDLQNTNVDKFNVTTGGTVGVGSSTPAAQFAIHANNGDTNQNLFLIGSSTASATTTLFKVTNQGLLQFGGYGAGSLQTDSSGNVTVSSDQRLKNVYANFDRGLSAIEGLNPVLFHWNEISGLNQNDINAGFIAQNVQQYIPEAVGQDNRGYLTLQDRPILAAAVNAIKDLANQATSLSTATTTLSLQVSDIQKQIATPGALTATDIAATSLSVSGEVAASTFATPAAQPSFLFGSTTITANIPSDVLTASGATDIFKLASYGLAYAQNLTTRVDTLQAQVNDIDTRLAALQQAQLALASSTQSSISQDAAGHISTTATTTLTSEYSSTSSGLQAAVLAAIQNLWSAEDAAGKPVLALGKAIQATTGFFDQVFAKEVHTDKVCVGETCIDEAQLKQLLQNQAASATTGATSASTVPTTTTTATASSTPDAGAQVLDATSTTTATSTAPTLVEVTGTTSSGTTSSQTTVSATVPTTDTTTTTTATAPATTDTTSSTATTASTDTTASSGGASTSTTP